MAFVGFPLHPRERDRVRGKGKSFSPPPQSSPIKGEEILFVILMSWRGQTLIID
jgi:hypothetical protein